MRVEILVLFTDIFQIPRTMPGVYIVNDKYLLRKEKASDSQMVTHQRGGTESGLDIESYAVSLPVSILSPLLIPPDEGFPARSDQRLPRPI